MPESVFWARLLELSTFGPDLLRLVWTHLSQEDRLSLRGVNKAMRLHINASVTHISCVGDTAPAHELLDVFPGVSSLLLRVCNYTSALAWLPRLSISSERMLANLQRLTLDIDHLRLATDGSFTRAVSQLVNR